MAANGRKYYQIASLERGLNILDLLTHRQKATVTEIAADLGCDRSACHRALLTMRDMGFVNQEGASGFTLSMKIFEMAMRMVNRLEIRPITRPFLEELRDKYKETVNLGVWDGQDVTYLDKCESAEVIRAELAVGARVPTHCSALGKAILAFRQPDEIKKYLDSTPLSRMTPNTLADSEDLRKELERIRSDGLAVDDEECYLGLRCVAAPIFNQGDRAGMSLSVSGPSGRITLNKLQAIGRDLKEACRRIEAALGRN
jgi:DNA-binding IclR family transcriptional regulator